MNTDYNEAEDIARKMEIANNIVKQVNRGDFLNQSPNKQFEILTGSSPADNYKEEMNFIDFQKANSYLFDFIKLRVTLHDFYVIQKKIPTSKEVLTAATPGKRPKSYTFDVLARNGFGWKQIPGTNKAIFMEDSERLAQRIGYLSKMIRFREAGKHFVYLNIGQSATNCTAAVSSKLGLLYDDYEDTKDRKEWLRDILHKLTKPCVFVYPQSAENKFTPFSPKQNLMAFLAEREIPFDPKSHRLELYELAKRFSKNEDDEITAMVTAFGHESIVRPLFRNGEPLDIFNPFHGRKFKFSQTYGKLDWASYEKALIAKEKQMYNEDLMVETVIDKIMTYGKYEGKAPDYLTDYSEVQKYDIEFGPANAFVD